MENGQNFTLDTMIITASSSNKFTFLSGSNIETINLAKILIQNCILKNFLEIKNYSNVAFCFCSFKQISFFQTFINIANEDEARYGAISIKNVDFTLLDNSKQHDSHLLFIKQSVSIDLTSVLVIKSNFENSEIFKMEQVPNNISIINSTFLQNSETSIFMLKGIKESYIMHSNFIQNYALSQTTCIYLENLEGLNAIISFFNVSFYENVANYNDNEKGLSIKAIYQGIMHVTNCIFLNNSITGTSISGNPSISIADDKFLYRNLIVSKSIFNYNSAIGDSLNIFFKGSYFEVVDSIFTYNFATENLELTYGNLFIIAENLKVGNCQIFNNSAGSSKFGYFEIIKISSSYSDLNYMNFFNIQIENNLNLKNSGAIEIVIKEIKSLFKITFLNVS